MDYRETNRQVIAGFRAGEPLPGMHRERLLLLTTTGRRTGDRHTTPMMFHREDGRLFVIASNVGAPRDPDWCVNLRADPAVTVEVGDEDGSPSYGATASVISGEDRADGVGPYHRACTRSSPTTNGRPHPARSRWWS